MKTVRTISAILNHVTLILGVIVLALFITDRFNRAMAFLANEMTRWLIAVFALLVIIEAVLFIVERRRREGD